MTGSSFSTAVGAWPKRDEEAFQRGKQVHLFPIRDLIGPAAMADCIYRLLFDHTHLPIHCWLQTPRKNANTFAFPTALQGRKASGVHNDIINGCVLILAAEAARLPVGRPLAVAGPFVMCVC